MKMQFGFANLPVDVEEERARIADERRREAEDGRRGAEKQESLRL